MTSASLQCFFFLLENPICHNILHAMTSASLYYFFWKFLPQCVSPVYTRGPFCTSVLHTTTPYIWPQDASTHCLFLNDQAAPWPRYVTAVCTVSSCTCLHFPIALLLNTILPLESISFFDLPKLDVHQQRRRR